MAIRIGIFGYGNLGKGTECAVRQNPDLELAAIFTRRDPTRISPLTEGVPVVAASEVADWAGKIDVMILCGGSATDLPVQTPELARWFNLVDSFDTHAKIPEHFAAVDAAASAAGTTALISGGWDPGLFSLNRVYAEAILPQGGTYTFWGKGVSQGHSDAIRRIEGVADARQYTVPVPEALEQVRAGQRPTLTTRQKHTRECYVAAKPGADLARIEQEIKTMPNYFADYDTTVTFVSLEQLHAEHSGLPHGGSVLRSGLTGWNEEHTATVEYSLKLDSNPEFTASVLAACARAVSRMHAAGQTGCKTILDVPPALLSPLNGEELRRQLL